MPNLAQIGMGCKYGNPNISKIGHICVVMCGYIKITVCADYDYIWHGRVHPMVGTCQILTRWGERVSTITPKIENLVSRIAVFVGFSGFLLFTSPFASSSDPLPFPSFPFPVLPFPALCHPSPPLPFPYIPFSFSSVGVYACCR